jgi:uroporphyrinogen III methyltransferase/synthase
VEVAGIRAPSVVVVGEVSSLRQTLSWWESSPLFGLGALVSRAPHQASELASALRAVGAVPSIRPLIDLVPNEEASEQGAIDTSLADLESYSDLLFTSSNAVRFFVHHAQRRDSGVDFAAVSARVLCIGAGTARAAMDAGLPVHFIVPGLRGDAESMLAEILSSGSPRGRRVLIPRSDIGRDILARGLTEAGAEVDAVVFYRNLRPEVDAPLLREDLCAGALPLLPFTSPSAVRHFAELLDTASREACERCIIAAIGDTTADALVEAGLSPQVIPRRPEVRELVAALERHVVESRENVNLPEGRGEEEA